MSSLRVAFLGNDPWSVPSLRALTESSHEVALVVTRVPRPAGRGNQMRPTRVAESARQMGLSLVEIETVRSGPGFERLREIDPDVLAVVAYGEILPPAVLGLARVAPVNLHFSLLPALRGAAPVQAALLHGMTETGVTTIRMDEGLDTGPILGRLRVSIAPDDDAGSLGARLAEVGGGLLVRTMDLLASGKAEPKPQRHEEATFAPKLGPDDRVLLWDRPARELVDRCRALSPRPAAATMFRGRPLRILRAEVAPASEGEPGRIVHVGRDGIVVATGRGGFRPLAFAPAGRRRMDALDFVNGLHPRVGEALG